MHKVDRASTSDQLRLGNGIDLRSVKVRSCDGELVGADVHVVLVDAKQRLVAKAGAARIIRVGGVKAIDRPRTQRAVGVIYRQVEAGVQRSSGRQEKLRGKPGMRRWIVVAARVALH